MIVVAVNRKSTMSDDEGWWKWAVVVAAFFVQFIICGITYSIGIFHVIFREIYDTDHFDTSWAGSILLYSTALTSVVLRSVMARLGCRLSVILGGILSCAGLGLGMTVTKLYQIYLTFGVLTGIGFGLACTPSIMAVEHYFKHGRFQALSVVAGGIGAGIITFPFIIRTLLDQYDFKGVLLIIAGGALNLCVCGMVMRPASKRQEVRLRPLLSCLPLRNPLFHGICIANLFWSFGSTVIYMYLPSYALEKGANFESASFLISCVGIASFTSRMIFAFMGHNSTLDDLTSSLCSIGLGIVVTGICPLLFSKSTGQIGYTLLFGFYSGYWTTFLSQVSRELIGPEYIAMGNGYLSFMVAMGTLSGGPAAGLLIQEENEFKYTFYLAGACLLWSSVIMMVFKTKKCGEMTRLTDTEEIKKPLFDQETDAYITKESFPLEDISIVVSTI